jgi:hypothetical protein
MGFISTIFIKIEHTPNFFFEFETFQIVVKMQFQKNTKG